MRILWFEMKKILTLHYLLAALAVYLTVLFLFPGPLQNYRRVQKNYNPERYTAAEQDWSFRYDILFQDMLLREYGAQITRDALPRLKEEKAAYETQLQQIIAQEPILGQFGLTNPETLLHLEFEELLPEHYRKIEDGNFHRYEKLQSDHVTAFFERLQSTRSISYQGKDYALDFPSYYSSVIAYLEEPLLLLPEGEKQGVVAADFAYDVLFPNVGGSIAYQIFMLLMGNLLFSLFVIAPYLMKENQRGLLPLQYSAKTGRRVNAYKLLAAALSSSLCLALSGAVSFLLLHGYGLARYYDSLLRTQLLPNRLSISWTDLPRLSFAYMSFGKFLWFLPLLLCLFGLGLCMLLNAVSSRCRNWIAALAAAFPFAVIGLLTAYRYTVQMTGMGTRPARLLFPGEPLIFAGALLLLAALVMLFQYRREGRREYY